MRAYERQAGESAKAFEAYKVFRDLGPGRTLAAAADIVYDRYPVGTKAAPGQIKKWSTDFDWVERARQRDDYIDMIRLQAVEEHEQERAADLVAREAALREQNRENEERAAAITAKYLDYAERLIDELPLTRQVTVREGEDGKPAIYQIEPATKNAVLDAARLHKIATNSEPFKMVARTKNYDLSKATEEQLERLVDGEDPDVVLGPDWPEIGG